MAVRIEDAGFEIRDMIAWVYGQGFPKSLDVSKAIDKAAGAEREVGPLKRGGDRLLRLENGKRDGGGTWGDESGRNAYTSIPSTEAAKQWEGWGTALKPALEPITLARKPPIGTIAANVLEHGTGGLNIDGCRIEANGDKLGGGRISTTTEGWDRPWKHDSEAIEACKARGNEAVAKAEQLGRFPANFIHDGSEEVLALLGEAARFYYSPKASRDDRDEGCGALEVKAVHRYGQGLGEGHDPNAPAMNRNTHSTVKPTDLMRYLCRLITPPGGIVLDPFTGSGSTGKAAMAEGFRFIGIEREAEYVEIARARISAEAEKPRQLSLF
jgi:site-specific DNA-methyltransferase (adenine-specific)